MKTEGVALAGVDKFVSRRPIFWARSLTCRPNQEHKKMGALNEYLELSFLMCFHQKFLQ